MFRLLLPSQFQATYQALVAQTNTMSVMDLYSAGGVLDTATN